jgi:hypothetical protein
MFISSMQDICNFLTLLMYSLSLRPVNPDQKQKKSPRNYGVILGAALTLLATGKNVIFCLF